MSATDSLRSDVSHEESADFLRDLVKTGLLKHTDLRDDPARFFEAHRILARHAVEHGPGFWIRFTVHYNLWAGTILAMGSDEQVAALGEAQTNGQIGCFGLTERLAGVQSGLIVQTSATWKPESGMFALNCATDGAAKNWISQGFTADKAVVMADLVVGGSSHGPHAFAIDLRDDTGALLDGVSMGDMGRKTTGNDLDNAWISFEDAHVPHGALLDRYAYVDAAGGEDGTGAYVQRVEGLAPFHMIGQRLFTGRIAVAQAALAYARQLFGVARAYADAKPVWGGQAAEPVPLAAVPQLAAIFAEGGEELGRLDRFVGELELELSSCLVQGSIPSAQLIEAIAVAKVKAVETSIALCFRLKQEVGSMALMADAGFAHMDFLQCCKFAEGDSRILMQKMARDRLKAHARGGGGGAGGGADVVAEVALCEAIAAGVQEEAASGADSVAAWNAQWQNVYELAELVMDRVVARYS
eukprot:g5395.t1